MIFRVSVGQADIRVIKARNSSKAILSFFFFKTTAMKSTFLQKNTNAYLKSRESLFCQFSSIISLAFFLHPDNNFHTFFGHSGLMMKKLLGFHKYLNVIKCWPFQILHLSLTRIWHIGRNVIKINIILAMSDQSKVTELN